MGTSVERCYAGGTGREYDQRIDPTCLAEGGGGSTRPFARLLVLAWRGCEVGELAR
jgi:hypothetical protein